VLKIKNPAYSHPEGRAEFFEEAGVQGGDLGATGGARSLSRRVTFTDPKA
jgi:hypothetical protein